MLRAGDVKKEIQQILLSLFRPALTDEGAERAGVGFGEPFSLSLWLLFLEVKDLAGRSRAAATPVDSLAAGWGGEVCAEV